MPPARLSGGGGGGGGAELEDEYAETGSRLTDGPTYCATCRMSGQFSFGNRLSAVAAAPTASYSTRGLLL
jgi:hypothetical protein